MGAILLKGSVGIGGKNNSSDVKEIQIALNKILDLIPPTNLLVVDGSLGHSPEKSKTVGAINTFQKKVVLMFRPDGIIDVNGKSHKKLNEKIVAKPILITNSTLPTTKGKSDLNELAYNNAAKSLGCEVAAIRAVADIESAGGGFLSSGRPKILFEAHVFSRETKRVYDTSHPKISSRRWNKSFYIGNEKEYDRLVAAMKLDRNAAIRSTSWGKFQIMGFNHKAAGYESLEKFLADMYISESKQLDGFVSFLKSKSLDTPLKNKDWATFAEGYNGSSYKENKYDTKLKAAYEKHVAVNSTVTNR